MTTIGLNLNRRIKTFVYLLKQGEFSLICDRLKIMYLMNIRQYLPSFISLLRRPYRFQAMKGIEPKVSVIVPNFNHAKYLRQRLNSIYGQTYKNIEVILLDDGSTDESREILQEYCDRYPDITRVEFNEVNSGKQCKQWAKGIGLSRSDLIWIAESDDYCELDFLSTMVKCFEDESVAIAYCNTLFVNSDGKKKWSTQEYLADLNSRRWRKAFVNSAHDEVRRFFYRKNLIANASSALFRKPLSLSILNSEEWLNLRIVGDWIFYLHLVRGGTIAFSRSTTNYYRIHGTNTSTSTHKEDVYYYEHQIVGETLAALYNISDRAIDGLYQKARMDWVRNLPERPVGEFEKLFDKSKVRAKRTVYTPSIAICGYAFVSGGGETFPIRLANSMKRRGYAVTFINFNLAQRNDGIRNELSKDIAVLNLRAVEDLRRIVKNFGFDIIHSHHGWVDVIVHIFCRRLKVKSVVTLHGMYEASDEVYIKASLPKLWGSVSKWVYTADKNLTVFRDFGTSGKKFVKISNAVEEKAFCPISLRNLGIKEGTFVICLVSRAIKQKGWFEAIDAVTMARQATGLDIELLLVGEGPIYGDILEKAPSYVHALGYRSDLLDLFASSDLGLLPTYFSGESFPLVVMDCLYAGTPMIASDVGEIRNMLTNHDGKIAGEVFALKDGRVPTDDLAEIIAKFAKSPGLHQEAELTVQSVRKKFDISKMVDAYEQVYKECFYSL